ncbi:MAG: leucine-rich repeat domain-containing protein [Capnocytophaga sp.]|nr:leucine-rich repeat domain-containing protein [Capnocytophaga sp.]
MKKNLLISLTAFLAIFILNCSKEDKTTQQQGLSPFSITPTEISVALKETATLAISSGNGEYKIIQTEDSKKIVQLSITEQNTKILVKAIKPGNTTATLTDVKSKKEVVLNIQVIIPASYYELSKDKKTLLKWKNNEEESVDLASDPILKNITSVGQAAFKENTVLKEVVLPENITFLAKESFAGVTKLETIKIPNTVTSIGESIFSGCTALKKVILPENSSFSKIPKRAFQDCKSLKTIILPNTIDEIGILAFADAGLTHITFPENLLTISQQAFVGNQNLKEITIPKNVTLISLAAFQETGLTKVTVEATLPPTLSFGVENQGGTPKSIEPFPSATLQDIFVPEEVTQKYRDKEGWHNYAKIINKNKGFKHLEISQKDVILFIDDIKQIEIISGNDDYDLEREESTKEIVYIGITSNQKILGIKGLKAGTAKVTLVDKITQEKVEISITVLIPFTLSPNTIGLKVGETKSVLIDGNGDYEIPTNAHVSLSLSSDKKKINIKGIKIGETKVTIKDKKANQSLVLSISVTQDTPVWKDFTLSTNHLSLKINGEQNITIQGNDNYEIGTSQIAQLTLSSDKKTLTIKGKKAGKESIKIKDVASNKELTLEITIFKALKLSINSIKLKVGDTKMVSVEGNGDYLVTNGQYASGNLSEDRLSLQIYGKIAGKGKIIVKDKKTNEEAQIEVEVTEKWKEFIITPTSVTIEEEETKEIKIQGNGEYEIEEDNFADAFYNPEEPEKLQIFGKNSGKGKIKVTDKKTGKEITIQVTVKKEVKEFDIDPKHISLKVGQTTMVTIIGNDDYEIGKSSKATITLSENKQSLVVKGIQAGTETVVIKDKKANKTISLSVEVLESIKPFNINPTEVTFRVGEIETIILEGNGEYQFGNSQLVEVVSHTQNMVTIRGKQKGTETFYITDKISNKTLSVKVTIKETLIPFSISPSDVRVKVGETAIVSIIGNGKYELSEKMNPYAELTLNNVNGTLTIKGVKEGHTELYIRDLYPKLTQTNQQRSDDSEDFGTADNYESRKLSITVIPVVMEKSYQLSWDNYAIEKWLNNDVEEVNLPQISELANIGEIGEGAFKGLSKLKKVVLHNKIEVIGRDAFANCTALEKINLGNNVSEIGGNAFAGCTKLKRIDIPKSILPSWRGIGSATFEDCTALQIIILRHTEVTPFATEIGGGTSATIYVPNEIVEEYKKDTNWATYKDRIQPISELTNRKTRK